MKRRSPPRREFSTSLLIICPLIFTWRAYIVTTNLFLTLPRGCKLGALVSSFVYLKSRRVDHASAAPPPALVNRPRAPDRRGRLRPGDPSDSAVGRHVSVDGAGCRRGAQLRAALSHPDSTRTGASGDAGVVGLGITQT